MVVGVCELMVIGVGLCELMVVCVSYWGHRMKVPMASSCRLYSAEVRIGFRVRVECASVKPCECGFCPEENVLQRVVAL